MWIPVTTSLTTTTTTTTTTAAAAAAAASCKGTTVVSATDDLFCRSWYDDAEWVFIGLKVFYSFDISRNMVSFSFLSYVYKLCDLHLSIENYTEAAFTLLRRADDLQVRMELCCFTRKNFATAWGEEVCGLCAVVLRPQTRRSNTTVVSRALYFYFVVL